MRTLTKQQYEELLNEDDIEDDDDDRCELMEQLCERGLYVYRVDAYALVDEELADLAQRAYEAWQAAGCPGSSQ